MSDIRRFLSRRERLKPSRDKVSSTSQPTHLLGLFESGGKDKSKSSEKELEKKIKDVHDRLLRAGIRTYDDSDIAFVLKSAYIRGDPSKAFDGLILLNDSVEGIIRPYDPRINLLGAENWNGISCYLDSILFSMFARLDSFEAMLYKDFDDPKRSDLAALIRVWVNTVRAGKLVEGDMVKRLQETLGQCGWTDAAKEEQQDASEAFSFITEKLDLPMLTLKMDLFHTGKEDVDDDHRFVRERLLEVAIPEDPPDGSVITLEKCLETYFNSRVEVKRYLERRGTMNSMSARQTSGEVRKTQAVHVESVELPESGPSTPATVAPPSLPPYSPIRPSPNPLRQQTRQHSIIQESVVYDKVQDEKAWLKAAEASEKIPRVGRQRTMSIKREVMMPAWQFFSLIPWYTDISPQSDAQIAAHFSSKRPVLGICLKRYLFTSNGDAIRRSTQIDVPIEIALPQFIHDDNMDKNSAAFGNFKLSLQSVVCHRGVTVYAGHYVSLVRGTWQDGEDKWMIFDDLASPRIRPIEIDRALREECPYLLFYQIQPIEGDPSDISRGERPPSYLSDAKDSAIGELPLTTEPRNSGDETATTGASTTGRPSLEFCDPPRGRKSASRERRVSIANTNNSTASLGTKTDDGTTNTLGTSISRKDSKRSRASAHSRAHSRATSQNGGDNKRFSTILQGITGKITQGSNPPTKAGELGVPAVDEPPLALRPSRANEPSAYSETKASFADVGMDMTLMEKTRGKLIKDRRDKSREKSASGKASGNKIRKSERPDRECVTM